MKRRLMCFDRDVLRLRFQLCMRPVGDMQLATEEKADTRSCKEARIKGVAACRVSGKGDVTKARYSFKNKANKE